MMCTVGVPSGAWIIRLLPSSGAQYHKLDPIVLNEGMAVTDKRADQGMSRRDPCHVGLQQNGCHGHYHNRAVRRSRNPGQGPMNTYAETLAAVRRRSEAID